MLNYNFDFLFGVIVFSALVNIFLILLSHKYKFCIDTPDSSNHKVHSKNVPRMGGVALFVSFVLSFLFVEKTDTSVKIVMGGLIIFIIGFVEDVFKNLSPFKRFVAISACVVLAMVYSGKEAVISSIGFKLPFFIAVFFTVFAITGVINAINISDGINGLSSGIAIIASFYLILICDEKTVGIFNLLLVFIASIIGFFVINFFTGKIFLGDGGAYFIGYILAFTSVILSNRLSDTVSPWYFLILLQYPVFETLFSIYRRRFLKNKNAFCADRLHMHTLIYRRVFKNQLKSTFLILSIIFVFSYVGYFFRSNTFYLILIFLIFCIGYIYAYNSIIKRLRYLH